MLRSTMQAARLRTLSRAVPARLGVLPAVQHGARQLCTGPPKEGEEGCGAVTPLPPWRHRNKKIVARSTGVLPCRHTAWPAGQRGPSDWFDEAWGSPRPGHAGHVAAVAAGLYTWPKA